ncbi:hypothetical protein [Candidatus Flexifilum breve]|uniref:hypothetical protein n=1 Tax=Candidatus Flexifilum breve TaxID=3140694 RepID=UPI0031CCD798
MERLLNLRAATQALDVRPSAEGYQIWRWRWIYARPSRLLEATVRSAIERRESRGAHQRSDFPNVDDTLRVNFIIGLNGERQQVLRTSSAQSSHRTGNVDARPSAGSGWSAARITQSHLFIRRGR